MPRAIRSVIARPDLVRRRGRIHFIQRAMHGVEGIQPYVELPWRHHEFVDGAVSVSPASSDPELSLGYPTGNVDIV